MSGHEWVAVWYTLGRRGKADPPARVAALGPGASVMTPLAATLLLVTLAAPVRAVGEFALVRDGEAACSVVVEAPGQPAGDRTQPAMWRHIASGWAVAFVVASVAICAVATHLVAARAGQRGASPEQGRAPLWLVAFLFIAQSCEGVRVPCHESRTNPSRAASNRGRSARSQTGQLPCTTSRRDPPR